ncbi:MAG: hypothetical protein MUC62_03085 [Candidatus Thermoplasmatota archaeon]|jgi:tRNA (guanine26-N2/guanine27-N2)-dimethyltransferase|nr:hypothetical protein [Candidatus Thermoplasmatota archaeon]
MGKAEGAQGGPSTIKEGAVVMDLVPSGGLKGPGTRSSLFYNPSMVQNRDVSVLFLSTLLEGGMLPGRDRKDILDGLCGSGIRAMRFALEIGDMDGTVRYMGCDREEQAVEHAKRSVLENKAPVEIFHDDLNVHLQGKRYSYIDVDPYGSPVQFVPSALTSLLSGGVLAVTATDTAALTGSARKASMRRYWTQNIKTEYLHEISCRVLAGYLARCASTIERAVQPIFLYSSDHYVRGYFRVVKSASKADSSMRSLGFLVLDPPAAPLQFQNLEELSKDGGGRQVLGPLWLGNLEDPSFIEAALRTLTSGNGPVRHLTTVKSLESMLRRALGESGLPPGGYDLNVLASRLKASPPPIEKVIDCLSKRGHRANRSRFSHTLVKTDAPFNDMKAVFMELSGGG